MKNKERKKGLLRRLSSYDDIKSNFILTKNVLKEEKKNLKKEAIKETFEDALKRHGVKSEHQEKHLNKVYKNLKLTSIISFIMSFIVFYLVTYNILKTDTGFILYAFYFIAFTILLKSIESAFRCFQIREKRLLNISEYLKNPKEWYPRKFIYKKESLNGE